MNQAITGLSITYVALAAILLGIFFLAKIPAWIKFVCVIMMSGFYYLNYYSLNGLLGWPTRQEIPEQFQLMASSINEPDESTGEPGSIHIWGTSFIDNKPAKEPRAYVLPYDLELHAALDEALQKQRQGKIQLGRRLEETDESLLPKDTSRYAQKQHRLEFYDLPDPELPEK